ncbi:hypothetical protein K432DRAFT_361651 [Lepidopterella palustris CBS 459.81]|uniref:Nucleolar 27S pre-rRNA processing Urb2/Npa2 C-terminal domain-containing protein n=1 Tax=Lepidopterella palustris CBS 459.81 TaxID=1314670 RepID=A0A8E2JAY4_9PEZI|nr:hypothetical protein K432DRAFT_361651 [Lepidopterella palustris CBS 459.81]
MAPISQSATPPSLPRLLSLDNTFPDLNDQIRQAAQIIGLPDGWDDGAAEFQCKVLRKQRFHARAEWVLRWILDKLKPQNANGIRARTNIKAWKLLKQAISLVPVINAASLLRTADYAGILERVLEENFGKDEHDKTVKRGPTQDTEAALDLSESSATAEEHLESSRKRKRLSSDTDRPMKQVALGTSGLDELFAVIANVLEAILVQSKSDGSIEDAMVAEHMKMVLRISSAQAARLLKFWLKGIFNLLTLGPEIATSVLDAPDHCLRLSPILEVWEMRTQDTKDQSDASANLFSTECLTTVATLLSILKDNTSVVHWGMCKTQGKDLPLVRKTAIQSLEQLLARHVFGPSRTAFFADVADTVNSSEKEGPRRARNLSLYLHPLNIKIGQAASFEGMSGSLPTSFEPLLSAIPQLLDIAIRCSLRHSPRKKFAERPWLQAVFVVLCECSGCPLRSPGSPSTQSAIAVLGDMLAVLTEKDVPVDYSILEDIFRFYAGMYKVSAQKSTIWWGLVAKLTALNPDIFLPKSKANTDSSGARPNDLSAILFEQISAFPAENLNSNKAIYMDDGLSIWHNFTGLLDQCGPDGHHNTVRGVLQQSILIPVLRAFAKNRDLLGFISRWHTQLTEVVSVSLAPTAGPRKRAERSIWEDFELSSALAPLLESTLTLKQTSGLFEQHGVSLSSLLDVLRNATSLTQSSELEQAFKNANSSAILVDVLLRCLCLDETVAGLEPQLKALHLGISALIEHEYFRSHADMAVVWSILSRLFALLWDIASNESPGPLHSVLDSKMIELVHENISANIQGASKEESDSAFAFLLTVCDRFRSIPSSKKSVCEHLGQALSAILQNTFPLQTESHKDGISLDEFKLDKTSIQKTFRKLELLLVRFPSLLEFIPSNLRASLFLQIYWVVSTDHTNSASDQLLQACSEFVFSNLGSNVRNDMLSALFAGIDNMSSAARNLKSQDLIEFSENLYFQIPLQALPRKHREAVLDRITDILLGKQELSREQVLRHLALMVQLMEVPNSSAKICTEPMSLIRIARIADKESIETDRNILDKLEALVKLILHHILSEKDQKRSQGYLEQIGIYLSHHDNVISLENPGYLAFVKAVMATVGKDEIFPGGNLHETIQQHFLSTFEKKMTGSTLSGLLKVGVSAPKLCDLDMMLDFLCDVPVELVGGNGAFERLKGLLQEWINPYFSPSAQLPLAKAPFMPGTWCLLHNVVARFHIYPDYNHFLRMSQGLLQLDLSAKEFRAILITFKKSLLPLDMSTKLQLLPSLLPSETDEVEVGSLPILHALISSFEHGGLDDADRKQQLSALLGKIVVYLPISSDIARFNSLLDCVNTILRDKPFLVSQFGIEALIAAILTTVCPTGPSLPPQHAPALFTRLCETTNILFSLHRSRLGGRFHLLIPLLQRLLSCFFISNATRRTKNPYLPPWIHPYSTPLTPANAISYTRLLTTLSSPTVSSVTGPQHHHNRSRKQAALVDATKKARQYAGQYIPSLIVWFCKCLLSGRLEPKVRERLMPGVWACLETVEMEALKAMSSGLGSNERAIWRGLYAEWRRTSGVGRKPE